MLSFPWIETTYHANNYLISRKFSWNTIYITDLFNQCKFYVRGNEFTNQLYHFIENILDSKNKSLSNFNNASITHKVIEEIIFDHKNNNDEKN